jgi:hypothetical protein
MYAATVALQMFVSKRPMGNGSQLSATKRLSHSCVTDEVSREKIPIYFFQKMSNSEKKNIKKASI